MGNAAPKSCQTRLERVDVVMKLPENGVRMKETAPTAKVGLSGWFLDAIQVRPRVGGQMDGEQ